MFRRSILKFSSLLLKIHLYINRRIKEKTSFKPYILDYTPSESKIKIIHINGNFIVGGSTQLIVDIIERTSAKYTHKIIVPSHPDPLPYQPVSIAQFPISQLSALNKYLADEKPSLVHIHYWAREEDRYEEFALWYSTIFKMCEELELKVIQNINVPTQPYPSSSVVHNVFVSNYVKQNFNNQTVDSSVIYPGSDFSHFSNSDIDSLPQDSIGMVYRLDRDKLNLEAIEVFIQAVKRKPELLCYIIGGGYYLKYYKKRVSEEGFERSFIFTGPVSYKSLPEFYKKISVFVAPVHNESFGQVSPFAMSMGLSIAGYNTGALEEILGYKDTLVNYGNIEKLADVIVDLVNDPVRRKKLGNLNKEKAHAYFSIESMINQYENLYASYL